jgi:hypothetical protein
VPAIRYTATQEEQRLGANRYSLVNGMDGDVLWVP